MLITADSVEELNRKVTDALNEGMFLWGSPFVVALDYHNRERFYQQVSNVDPSSGVSNGNSAYQIWTEHPGNENKTLDEYIESMEGTPGESAYEVWKSQPGNNDKTIDDYMDYIVGQPGKDGIDGKDGKDGVDGKSTYDIWKEQPGNENKSVSEFLASIHGTNGLDG